MVREVQEETGLVVRSQGIAGIDSFREEEWAFHGIRIIYYTECIGGTLTHELDGSTDLCAWWTLEEARQLQLVDLVDTGLDLAFPSK